MVLSKEDAELFYELFFPLLDFVNKKYGINAGIGEIYFGKTLDPLDAKEIADRLWENAAVIDEYLAEKKLSEEHKNIILGWKKRISGKFIVERHLKRGSVFICAETEEVYFVSGIISSWDEMLCGRPLPAVLEAVLIPFKNVIISDGLVSASNLFFGKNLTEEFKAIYLNAKKNRSVHKFF